MVIFSFLILLFTDLAKRGDDKSLNIILKLTLVICVALSTLYYGGLYQEDENFVIVNYLIIATCMPVSLLFLSKTSKHFELFHRYKFFYLLFFAILLRIFMIISSPQPRIDVYNSLELGSKSLLELKNPYTLTFPKIYPNQIPTLYGYFPGSAVILMPFTLLLGDPRYAYVFADFGSAAILFLILKNLNKKDQQLAELMPLIFLYNPMSLYVIEQSYLEPLTTFFLFLFVYLYLRNKVSVWPFVAIAVSLTIKQSMILVLLPLLLKLRVTIKQLAVFTFMVALVIGPFFLWNPKEFIFDLTTGFNPIYNTAPTNVSLNVDSLIYKLTGQQVNNLIRFSVIIFFVVLIFKKSKNNALGFAYSFTLFTFTITLFYVQAFLNYFTFVSSLILITTAVSLLPDNNRPTTKT